MKTKEIKELNTKPVAELEKMLRENQEKLRTLRFDLTLGKVKNTSELGQLKKLNARLSTYIHEKKR